MPPVSDSLPARLLVTVVAKLASSPIAAASSFRVSRSSGALSITAATAVSVYVLDAEIASSSAWSAYAFASTRAWSALVVASAAAAAIASASAVSAYASRSAVCAVS